ncbi:2-polyprenyl-6-methoxyphenol hydroxylase-like FAD-dependent oxidoreductase [Pontibacter mucosus]|uniref:2-polyprenyl-6-methoxyphenol hydroxylase-like FAD-dependent oxidoreductase n=1 Tax=Pontibacter mucosus TaxID=1649266 RepID=A0A2T5YEY6_9BACT|nr:FAD-dependent monooxygenase [Pontibacter mucosus]PTX15290.1 2-polyprenyl-6-methoxyphenol hydroxylase-like FAD-dependent oxidoreductase [Pontibacter mucosus]
MKVIVVGGGIGGLCAAIALQQAGFEAEVYEAAPELKPVGAGVGLAANAMQGLQRLGVADEVVARGRQLEALTIFDERGGIISNMDTRPLSRKYGINNFVIHRPDLHDALAQRLQPGTLYLNKRCQRINQQGNQVQLYFTDGTTATADLLIAADGINSAIRQQLLPQRKPRYAGYTCWRGVIENPGVAINEKISAETWAPQGRVGIAPLKDDKVYWYACINAPQNSEQMRRTQPTDLAEHFADLPPAVPAILGATPPEQLIWGDIADLRPLKRFAYGRVLLLGDAAHATSPNMGQGACQAIEDAVVLGQCLQQEKSIERALIQYEQRRLARTAKVIRLSRLLGAVSQWENPVLRGLRKVTFGAMPTAVTQSQMEWLYQVDF